MNPAILPCAALFGALHFPAPITEGWRLTKTGWEYVDRGRVLTRLTSAWDQSMPVTLVDGIHVFRDVDDASVCGYDGPRRLWARTFDLGSPDPMVVGRRLLALRSGKHMIWAQVNGTESVAELRRRWSVRRMAAQVEVLTARGVRRFSGSVYDVGEPRCFFEDRHLWTVRETNARASFLASEGIAPRFSLCLRNAATGRLIKEWKLPEQLRDEWFSSWRAEAGRDGSERVLSSRGLLFSYHEGTLRIGRPMGSERSIYGE